MTEYFTNNSRPYAENFNDGILLSDAVDLTVKASIPSMYSDESFNSNLNVERLAGVSVVTMVANTGVTVGSTSLSGTGSVTFRVYPNFGLFEKWNRISWTGTGDVSCSLAKVDGTPISVSVANGSALASNVELSKLQQLDVTFVLGSASVSDISFEFVASADTDLVVASISQANVTGLESSLSNLDSAISTGLSNLDSAISTGLSGKVNMTQIIPSSSNLDNYKTTGFYSSEEGISDVAYSNTPTKHGKGFTLLVESIGNRHCKQTFTSFYEPCEMYVRVCYNNHGDYRWRDWRKVAFE